ncbi:MAG: hypothetical protein WCS70_08770 [Verrucomicrobiota bacterium]
MLPNKWNKIAVVTACLATATVAFANERVFTYTYEPETLVAGTTEFEQLITLRTQRSKDVGQENYNRWEIREELEYGVTDRYTVAGYLNLLQATNYKDPTTGKTTSTSDFKGISIENRYMVLNPAEHAVGLALYLEPGYDGEEAELEQRIILGQRHGDWKWAVNLKHETEWELNEGEYEGEFEVDLGITRQLNNQWSLGLEFRNHNVLPEYDEWKYTAFFIGPVVAFRTEKWWATLTVLPQIWGKNTGGGPQPVNGFELEDHERLNIRLIFGFGL